MLFSLKLFLLELKRMFKLMPKLFLSALALCVVLSGLAFGSQALLYNNQPQQRLNIIMYIPENDKYIDIMMSIVENIKSVKSLCKFSEVSTKAEVYTAVEQGEAYAGIIFPQNFVQGIVRGQNYSATLVVPAGTNTDSALFKELTEGGSGMLSAVQAGIYAFIDEYELSNAKKPTEELINNLNMEYVNFVLPRENYFSHNKWSATSSLTPTQYYIVMAITILLLFWGMSCVKIVHTDYKEVYKMGKPYGFSFITGFFIKHILIFILFSILSLVILMTLKLADMDISFNMCVFLGIWLAAAIVTAVYSIIKNSIAGGLIIFAYTLLSGVLSGCFLPVSFLPEKLNSLYPFMPTYYITQCFNTSFDVNEVNFMAIGVCLVIIYSLTFVVNGGEE